jgi:phage terminase large subunit-like protein
MNSPALTAEALDALSDEELEMLEWRLSWQKQARQKQLPPPGDWTLWLIMAGRGFGKTMTGANWLAQAAVDDPGSFNGVIAPTLDDVRYTCFEGITGILSYVPQNLISDYNKSSLIIYLTNGSIIRGFGSEKPERLRGPQHHRVWGDELAAWQNARQTYDMMKFGLRLGTNPQFAVTTTPKPLPMVRELVNECLADEKEALETGRPYRKVLVRGTTYENRENLAPSFFDDMLKYEGTRLGDQELHGKLIDPEEDGIIKRSQWRMWKHDAPLPKFIAILMSLDTAYTEKTFDKKTHTPDPSAEEVWGLFQIKSEMHVMLLDAWDDLLGLPELVKRVRDEMAVTYGAIDKPLLGGPLIPSRFEMPGVEQGKGIDVCLVEDKGSGISLRQTLALENLLLEPYNPGRADKLARVHQITPMFAHGRVWAVESEKRPGTFKSWAEKVITQVCSYHGPGTVDNDDYVDCLSQAMNYFMRNYINTWVKQGKDEVVEGEKARPVGYDDPNVILLPNTGTNPYDC